MYSSYAPDRKGDDGWRDDDWYEKSVEGRDNHGPREKAEQVVVRSGGANRHRGAPAVSSYSPIIH
jgi:hypothetical protein